MKYFMSMLLAGVSLVPLTAKAADMGPPPPSSPIYSGIYLRGDLGASWLSWGSATNSWAYLGNAGIGYQFDQNLRADLTYDWTGNYNVAPSGTLNTNIVMGNLYYDFRNESAFTPYLGAGIGYGWENATGVGAISTSGVAVGLAAGVSYDFTNNLALDVGYRFHDILATNQQTPEHQIAAGIRVKF